MNTESVTHSSSRPAARKVLVVGATGGSGRAAVEALAGAGHHVTAFSRHADRLVGQIEGITTINGDAMNKTDADHAVAGHDAVIVTLGITENPIRVRILGPKHTPADVRSAGTRNVIDAMKSHGIERLVVQSSYGIGETAQHLRIRDRLFFALLVKQQMADTAVQESVVRSSGLDWTLVQPVHLTEAVDGPDAFTSTDGRARKMTVGRGPVGRVLAAIVDDGSLRHKTVSVSG